MLSIYGCEIQRKTYCERKKAKVVRILKDCPNIIETATIHDTISIHDTTTIYIETEVDSSHIDSLLKAYCDAISSPAEVKPDSQGKAQVIRQIIYRDREHSKDGTYNLKDQKGRPVHLVINGKKMTIEAENSIEIETPTITLPCPDKEKDLYLWQKFKANFSDWLIIFICGTIFGILLKFLLKIIIR